jgi:Skp family chaperone for outer membrane proteins/Holliday junction resolvase-like predicted endonuclease
MEFAMPSAHQRPEPLSFEKVWAMFQETDRKFQETNSQFKETDKKLQTMFQETDRKFQETSLQFKETDKKLQAMFQETDRKFQESDRKFLETQAELARLERQAQKRYAKLETLFTGQWGKLIESLVEGRLVKLLNERNIKVKQTFQNATDDSALMEIDIIADNTSETVVVEVKTTLKIDDVDYFIGKLERFKQTFPVFANKKVYGAVAFLKSQSNIRAYAEKKGLFVIKATGESSSIVNKQEFSPKAW